MPELKLDIKMPDAHTCGAKITADQKYCQGCGKKLFSSMRSESEMKAMLESFEQKAKKADHLPQSLVQVYSLAVLLTVKWAQGMNPDPSVLLDKDAINSVIRFEE